MENIKKIPMISIVGPTASGKTALSIELAKVFDGEIVCADSMQIYKGMDIATAKPTYKEQQGIKHHLMGFLDIDKAFSVAQYCELAHKVIKDIYNRGNMPILVGGTGLYIDSLIDNVSFVDCDTDEELRTELKALSEQHGVSYLLDMLNEFDPLTAQKLSIERNVKRIIRAIEVYKTTGETIAEHNARSKNVESPYKTVKIGLTANDRQFLYDRINKRVDLMVESGLIDEAKSFIDRKHSLTSSMAIGHKELLPFFRGDSELETCLENLKMQTRRYAKRQLTWFNRDKQINWFYLDTMNTDELINKAVELVKKVLFNE